VCFAHVIKTIYRIFVIVAFIELLKILK